MLAKDTQAALIHTDLTRNSCRPQQHKAAYQTGPKPQQSSLFSPVGNTPSASP